MTVRVERFVHPAVVGFELWDLELSDGILHDGADLHRLLNEALELLRRGTAVSRSRGQLPAYLGEFDVLILCGGRLLDPELRAQLDSVSDSVIAHPDPEWTVVAGAERALRGPGSRPGSNLIVDLGQTRLKIQVNGRRRCFSRPLHRLPVWDQRSSPRDIETQRQRLGDFLADSIRNAADGALDFDEVACALPCSFDVEGVPEASSYLGLQGYATLIPDIFNRLGPRSQPWRAWVLNDAEAAAIDAARLAPDLASRALVLTLGHGVGAAWVDLFRFRTSV